MRLFNYRLQEEATEGGEGMTQDAPQEQPQEQGSLIEQSAEPQLGENEYLLIDGVKGVGERPEWYKADKYKTVAEQARAYTELEKKFGSFTGAPKDGYQLPEGLDAEDELAQQVIEWGTKNNLSQEGFNDLLTLAMAQSQATQEVNREMELKKLGDNAAQRIKQVETFLKQKAGDKYEEISGLVTSADDVLLVEKIMEAIQPPKLPIDGVEIEGKPTWADIEREMWRKDEHGNLLRSVDHAHEMKIQRMLKEYGGDRLNNKVVG